jgi:hypothetical protein
VKYWLIMSILLSSLLFGCPSKDDSCQCNSVPESLQNKYVGGSCEETSYNSNVPAAKCFYNSEQCCLHWGHKWSDPASWGSE